VGAKHHLFSGDGQNIEETIAFSDVQNPELEKKYKKPANVLVRIRINRRGYPKFDCQDILDGKLQPVFFA
jgi:peptide chain release factor 3